MLVRENDTNYKIYAAHPLENTLIDRSDKHKDKWCDWIPIHEINSISRDMSLQSDENYVFDPEFNFYLEANYNSQ